jgi:hypothetical protein
MVVRYTKPRKNGRERGLSYKISYISYQVGAFGLATSATRKKKEKKRITRKESCNLLSLQALLKNQREDRPGGGLKLPTKE